MNDKIYVSTGAFNSRNIDKVLSSAQKAQLLNIELAPGIEYNPQVVSLVKKRKSEFSFLIHNYFPTPSSAFGLNLASSNSETIKKSLDMCFANIDLAAQMGISLYTIHCGFCFDTDGRHLGNKSQTKLKRIPIEVAEENFVSNIQAVCDYALDRNVIIGIENNVIAEYAASEKDMYLGITGEDIKRLLNLCDRHNLKVLLDLAHAKVSATFLDFNVINMIDLLIDDIIEVHISDNDGRHDLNMPLNDNSEDMISWLEKLKQKIWTLEAYNLSTDKIREQIGFLAAIKSNREENRDIEKKERNRV